jgi:NTE family protein
MCKATGDQHKRLTQIMTLTQTRMVINKFTFAIGVLWALGGCSQLPIGGAGTAPGDARAVATAPVRDALAAVPKRPARLGLALGGGAARGFAHVGVIQVLEREGIRPDLLAGTSAGSLVAVLYASGLSGAELERVALGMEEATLTDWTLPLGGRGFLRGEALARYVRQAVDGKSLENPDANSA